MGPGSGQVSMGTWGFRVGFRSPYSSAFDVVWKSPFSSDSAYTILFNPCSSHVRKHYPYLWMRRTQRLSEVR